ncbi:hypothetical protein QE152_g6511 [Popillia japonica]|uniref:Uncharacterized protein n=1 Tax=Popillia japonica TaxID=7064 RepID=A0AAW1MIC0_POPJA
MEKKLNHSEALKQDCRYEDGQARNTAKAKEKQSICERSNTSSIQCKEMGTGCNWETVSDPMIRRSSLSRTPPQHPASVGKDATLCTGPPTLILKKEISQRKVGDHYAALVGIHQ